MEKSPITEASNPRTKLLDALSSFELVGLLAEESVDAARSVARVQAELGLVVDRLVQRCREGGRVHYFGAGTSGRLGVLDAAEIPPTFGAPPSMFCAHIAGGDMALRHAVEGAEDDADAGALAVRACVRAPDALVAISASGGAPYVLEAIRVARTLGAYTVALTSVASSEIARLAENCIVLETGAEPLTGSTRMLAGAAQKIALATLSTSVMVRLGYVYENLMVGVVPTNAKLRRRAVRLVELVAGVGPERAAQVLAEANGSVKLAIVIARRNLACTDAQEHLTRHGGNLRAALDAT